jgi:hypothetical protein
VVSHVEQAVAARIAAARRRTEDMRRQRAELAAARKRGLAKRHAAKLASLRGAEDHAAASQVEATETVSPAVSTTVNTAGVAEDQA